MYESAERVWRKLHSLCGLLTLPRGIIDVLSRSFLLPVLPDAVLHIPLGGAFVWRIITFENVVRVKVG
jgi:hypothetical protein